MAHSNLRYCTSPTSLLANGHPICCPTHLLLADEGTVVSSIDLLFVGSGSRSHGGGEESSRSGVFVLDPSLGFFCHSGRLRTGFGGRASISFLSIMEGGRRRSTVMVEIGIRRWPGSRGRVATIREHAFRSEGMDRRGHADLLFVHCPATERYPTGVAVRDVILVSRCSCISWSRHALVVGVVPTVALCRSQQGSRIEMIGARAAIGRLRCGALVFAEVN